MQYTTERLADLAETRRPTPAEEQSLIRLARSTAGRWGHLGDRIEHEDLVSAAYLGAWVGFLTWQEAGGSSLSSWVIGKCRSAVLEFLRAEDPLSRRERARYREALAGDPMAPEPRRFLSIHLLLKDHTDDDSGTFPHANLVREFLAVEDAAINDLPDRLEREKRRRKLRRALSALPEKELTILRLIYGEEKTLKGAGKAIDRCESRAKQLRDQALRRIREALEAEP